MFNIAKKDKGKWKCDLVTWDGNFIKDKTIEDGWANHDLYEHPVGELYAT